MILFALALGKLVSRRGFPLHIIGRIRGADVSAVAGRVETTVGEAYDSVVPATETMTDPQKPDSAAPPVSNHETALVMDSSGHVIEWASGAEAIFHWTSAEAVGRRLSELIIPERFRSMHEAGLKRFIGGGPGTVLNRAIEIAAIDRDGGEFTVEVHITPEKTADGFRFVTSVRKI